MLEHFVRCPYERIVTSGVVPGGTGAGGEFGGLVAAFGAVPGPTAGVCAAKGEAAGGCGGYRTGDVHRVFEGGGELSGGGINGDLSVYDSATEDCR